MDQPRDYSGNAGLADAPRWKRRYTVLIVLILVETMAYLDRKAIFLVLPFVAAEFHMGPIAMGLVGSAFSATYLLAQIPGGMLTDRFGIRRVGTVSVFSWSIFLSLTGAATNYVHLLIARLGFGLGHGVYYPPCLYKTITIWFPKKQRATATASVLAFAQVGKAIAPAIVLGLAAIWNWRVAFYALALPCVIFAFLFWKFVPNSPAESKGISAEELAESADPEDHMDIAAATAPKMSMLQVFRQPNVPTWFSILFTFEIIAWAFPTWLPTFLLKARGFSTFEMGLTITLASLAGAAGAMSWGWLSDRYFSANRHWLIIASQLLAIVATTFMIFATSMIGVMAGAIIATLALAAFFPAFWAMPMVALSKKSMGLSSGVINMGGQIAAILAPLVTGVALQLSQNDYRWAFGLQIATTMLSLLITAIAFSTRRKGTPQVPNAA